MEARIRIQTSESRSTQALTIRAPRLPLQRYVFVQEPRRAKRATLILYAYVKLFWQTGLFLDSLYGLLIRQQASLAAITEVGKYLLLQ